MPESEMRPLTMGSLGHAYPYALTLAAPADWPQSVMRDGSPPKAAMFLYVHSTLFWKKLIFARKNERKKKD